MKPGVIGFLFFAQKRAGGVKLHGADGPKTELWSTDLKRR
jgi:hypothetical protein